MCGRFAAMNRRTGDPISELVEGLLSSPSSPKNTKVKSQGEVFPTDTVPVIFSDGGALKAALMIWGYPGIPSLHGKGKNPLFNARVETALALPTWSASLNQRRSIVPAGGFFEFLGTRGKKEKWLFQKNPEENLFMAGIYKALPAANKNDLQNEKGSAPQGEGISYCFSILTTKANDSVLPIHDRMPVVLDPEEFPIWFSENFPSLFDRSKVVLSKKLL
jgi:putative SOS response-associated peptidase YedK